LDVAPSDLLGVIRRIESRGALETAQQVGQSETLQVTCAARFWEGETEAFPRTVKTFYSQGDLERRSATRQMRRDQTQTNDPEYPSDNLHLYPWR
jgi:hypothetical protein